MRNGWFRGGEFLEVGGINGSWELDFEIFLFFVLFELGILFYLKICLFIMGRVLGRGCKDE